MSEENEGAEESGDNAEGARGASIFDLFEPPPDIDDSRFVPVVDVDGPPPTSDDVEPADPDATGPLTADDLDEDLDGVSDDADFDDDDDDEFEDERADLAAIYELLPESERGVDTPPADPSTTGGLPAWTDPPTSQVPAVLAGSDWSESSGPTWKGEEPDDGSMDDLSVVLGDDAEELTAGIARRVNIDDDASDGLPGAAGAPQRSRPTRLAVEAEEPQGRNIPQAIAVGVIVAGLALVAFWLGNVTTLALVVALAAGGVTELFVAMRRVGLAPANLLGIAAAVAMPLGVYHRGEEGYLLVSAMVMVFGALWYVVGADTHRPALNLGLTMLGTYWVAGLASFAVLFLASDDGPSFILAAILPTVAFDVLAFAGGSAFGKNAPRGSFHPASPNKTWAGTIVGFFGAIAGAMIVWLLTISAFADNWRNALFLGVVVGVLCPLGDLVESMIKRDLGVKDMGTLLPGHGGILDRIDGLLFVLPGAYYLARVLELL